MEDGEFWFWASPDGSLKTVDQSELMTGLRTGTMSPKTLVWRVGWREWVHAGQVPELSLSVPVSQRGPVIRPMMSPDATHPPPIPVESGASIKVLEPIVPVASTPENDRPGTELMIDIEFSAPKHEPVKSPVPTPMPPPKVASGAGAPAPSAPVSSRKSAPPSRKSAPPAVPTKTAPAAAASKPIVPAAPSPNNDKPTTLADSEIVMEESPPRDLWDEVAASQPPLESKPTAPKASQPIVPVESSPHHEPITGLIGEDEIEVIEEAAGPTARSLPKTPAPSSPATLDSLAASIEAKKAPRPQPVIAVNAPRPTSSRPPPPSARRPSPSRPPPPPSVRQSSPAVAPSDPAPAPAIAAPPQQNPFSPPAPIAAAPVPAPAPDAAIDLAVFDSLSSPAPAVSPEPEPQAPVASPHRVVVAPAQAPNSIPRAGLPHAVTMRYPNPILTPPPEPEPEPVQPEPMQAATAAPRQLEPIVPVSDPENDAPTQIHQPQFRDEAAPLPHWDVDADRSGRNPAEASQQAAWAAQPPGTPLPQTPYAPTYEAYAPRKKSALPLVLGLLGVFGVLGVGAAGIGLYYFTVSRKAPEPTPVAQTTAVAPSVASAPKLARCMVTQEAKRLAPAVVVGVPPYVTQVKGSTHIAVGLAQSDTAALGLDIDPSTLETKEVFTQPGVSKVVGVVPLVRSEKTKFVADREGGLLGVPHSIDADPAYTIGFSAKGYTRLSGNNQLDAIWPGVANEKATEARVVSVAQVGHLVAFRTGGQVRAGWIKLDGSKKTELGAVDGEGSKVGTPNVGANDKSVMVAFAARASDSDPWSVQLATAKHGENPNQAKRFALPSGGPGGDGIAPSVAGLSDGRWLVQWTEGAAGQRVVRAVTLDERLQPVGEALRVSAAGKEAGQGVIAVAGERAVAFHLVKGEKAYELWGTALSCK